MIVFNSIESLSHVVPSKYSRIYIQISLAILGLKFKFILQLYDLIEELSATRVGHTLPRQRLDE